LPAISKGLRTVRDFFNWFKASRIKPVIIWKAGLTVSGARAVRSHTASLAGQKAVWEAFFKQTGAISVNSLEELIDTLIAFYYLAPHKGRRVGILGISDAISVSAADTCERMGFLMPAFTDGLSKKLKTIVPTAGSSNRNPIDLGGPKPDPEMFKSEMEAVLSNGEVDTVVVDGFELYAFDAIISQDRVKKVAKVPVDINIAFPKKEVIVLPAESTEVSEVNIEIARREVTHYYLKEGIPVFLTLERAAKALAHLADYYEYLDTVSFSD
jgi:acyl-CoA synthetase (NDP forming)